MEGWRTHEDFAEFDKNWLDSYDHYTSDFEYEPKPLEPDYDFDWVYGCKYSLDLSLVNSHKLKTLNNSNATYNAIDPAFIHPDVAYRLAYTDPLHWNAVHVQYRKSWLKIERLIAKHCKECCSALFLINKIKSDVKYKKNWSFRKSADFIINMLSNESIFIRHNERSLYDYDLVDGTLWRKTSMKKYLGYGYKEVKTRYNGAIFIKYEEI